MILDTNAISAIADQDQAILNVISNVDELTLPYISIAEFQYGLLGSKRSEVGTMLLQRLSATIPIIFPNHATINHYASIANQLKRKGRAIPHNDIWIAALARQHSFPILSKDQHFDFVDGINRLEW
jgi:tRNA(fMet)-specific endonuclease VapC